MTKIRNKHLIEQLEGWRIDADFGLRATGFASVYTALCSLMHMLDGKRFAEPVEVAFNHVMIATGQKS